MLSIFEQRGDLREAVFELVDRFAQPLARLDAVGGEERPDQRTQRAAEQKQYRDDPVMVTVEVLQAADQLRPPGS